MVAEAGAGRDPDADQEVPRHLLDLHEKANSAGLDGEGIQAWLEWEMEALLWGVPAEISGADLEDLVEASEVPVKRVETAPDPRMVKPHHYRGAGSREEQQALYSPGGHTG